MMVKVVGVKFSEKTRVYFFSPGKLIIKKMNMLLLKLKEAFSMGKQLLILLKWTRITSFCH